MRTILTVVSILLLAGCTTPAPKGGNASQTLPAPVMQQLTQPEAPEGTSRQSYVSTVTEHRVDGTVVVTRTEAETELGGSQDWVAAIEAASVSGKVAGALMAIVLGIGAVAAYSKQWPSIAFILLIGAVVSIAVAWWAGLVAAAGGWLLYAGWQMRGVAIP